MDQRCLECVGRSTRRLLGKFGLNENAAGEFGQWYQEAIKEENRTVLLQWKITRKLSELSGTGDLFAAEKKTSNELAASIYKTWKKRVRKAGDPFALALKLTLAGNIMDYGAHDSFDLEATIATVLTSSFAIDHTEKLREKLARAGKVLYLADNAGEIMFDRLLLETIGHRNVVFAVRGGPVLNDATLADAGFAGINALAKVISSGIAVPSTIIEQSSDEFRQHFAEADLVISKGQGNLEGLIEHADAKIFFLLMAKCAVIADRLRVPEGSFIVMNSQGG